MAARSRSKNIKTALLQDFNCRNKVTGGIRCVTEKNVCNTEREKNSCEPSDPDRWALNEKVLQPSLREYYARQLGSEFYEDPGLGIFGKRDNVIRHREQYDLDRPKLIPYTLEEIKTTLKAKGKTVPMSVKTWQQVRDYAESVGITADDIDEVNSVASVAPSYSGYAASVASTSSVGSIDSPRRPSTSSRPFVLPSSRPATSALQSKLVLMTNPVPPPRPPPPRYAPRPPMVSVTTSPRSPPIMVSRGSSPIRIPRSPRRQSPSRVTWNQRVSRVAMPKRGKSPKTVSLKPVIRNIRRHPSGRMQSPFRGISPRTVNVNYEGQKYSCRNRSSSRRRVRFN